MQRELKFLVDVGVSRKVELWLQHQHYDTICVRDINPGTEDDEILRIAVSQDRMVITMDKDFGELVYNSGLPHAGVLLLRLEDESSKEKLRAIQNILKDYSDKIQNKFCVYQRGKLRIRS